MRNSRARFRKKTCVASSGYSDHSSASTFWVACHRFCAVASISALFWLLTRPLIQTLTELSTTLLNEMRGSLIGRCHYLPGFLIPSPPPLPGSVWPNVCADATTSSRSNKILLLAPPPSSVSLTGFPYAPPLPSSSPRFNRMHQSRVSSARLKRMPDLAKRARKRKIKFHQKRI